MHTKICDVIAQLKSMLIRSSSLFLYFFINRNLKIINISSPKKIQFLKCVVVGFPFVIYIVLDRGVVNEFRRLESNAMV